MHRPSMLHCSQACYAVCQIQRCCSQLVQACQAVHLDVHVCRGAGEAAAQKLLQSVAAFPCNIGAWEALQRLSLPSASVSVPPLCAQGLQGVAAEQSSDALHQLTALQWAQVSSLCPQLPVAGTRLDTPRSHSQRPPTGHLHSNGWTAASCSGPDWTCERQVACIWECSFCCACSTTCIGGKQRLARAPSQLQILCVAGDRAGAEQGRAPGAAAAAALDGRHVPHHAGHGGARA